MKQIKINKNFLTLNYVIILFKKKKKVLKYSPKRYLL